MLRAFAVVAVALVALCCGDPVDGDTIDNQEPDDPAVDYEWEHYRYIVVRADSGDIFHSVHKKEIDNTYRVDSGGLAFEGAVYDLEGVCGDEEYTFGSHFDEKGRMVFSLEADRSACVVLNAKSENIEFALERRVEVRK